MIALRRHAHRGSVLAVGVVIEPARIGEAEARRRVLAWWTPGCELRGVDGAWVLRLAAPRRVAVATAPGALLVAQDGALAALPLPPRLAAPPGAVVIARGGALIVVPPGEGAVIDPAAWLAVDRLEVLTASPLAPPPPPPAPVIEVERDARTVLGVAAQTEEAAAARAALSGATSAEPGAGEGEGTTSGVRTKPAFWARAVSSMFGAPKQGVPGEGGAPAEPKPPGWFDRLRDRAARAIAESRLGQVIGQRHADYLRETLAMFDRGDLDEALRRAIPIGGEGDGASRPALGLPTPRTDLSPSLAPSRGATSSIAATLHAMQLLQDRYEAARDRLLRDGRIEEAAFVVADLLGDPTAAVALLERHGRTRLAAELAEARGLPPGLVVRQWFVAGEPQRAIAVAWRTGAYADALARLQDHDVLASRLRAMWAHTLADAGDYLGAVEVGRPLPVGTVPLPLWIDRGIAAGGVAAARLWLIRLALDPARLPEVRAAVLAILATDADELLPERIAIARGLEVASGAGAALLARAAARVMLAEVGRGVDGEPAVLLPKLVRVAGDPALRADLPALGRLPPRDALVDRDAPWRRAIGRADAGAIPVLDVALLAGGRLAVALGEVGVRVLGRDGQTIARFDQPADALVVNDHGTHAIAVARRGGVRRLARLDVAARTVEPWCEVALDGWAPTFDGLLWLVHRGRDLLALDVTERNARATWSVSADAGGAWDAIDRDGVRWAAIGIDGDTEAWGYERFTLRRRAAVPPPPSGERATTLAVVADTGAWVAASASHDRTELVTADWRLPLDHAPVRALAVASRLVAITSERPGGLAVEVVYLPTRKVVAALALDGAQHAAVRIADLCLVVGDDRGRVIVVDLRSGAVRRDLRLV